MSSFKLCILYNLNIVFYLDCTPSMFNFSTHGLLLARCSFLRSIHIPFFVFDIDTHRMARASEMKHPIDGGPWSYLALVTQKKPANGQKYFKYPLNSQLSNEELEFIQEEENWMTKNFQFSEENQTTHSNGVNLTLKNWCCELLI